MNEMRFFSILGARRGKGLHYIILEAQRSIEKVLS